MGQYLDINPANGDYVVTKGDLVETDSLSIPAFYRCKIRRTQWMYAPDDQYGSDFYLVKKRRTNQNASTLEAMAARALQPIADDGRASQITVTTTAIARQGVQLESDLTPSGKSEPDNLVLPQI